MKYQILDCTLRDGGYYNNWNFPQKFLNNYLRIIVQLPVSDVELGYINPHSTSFKGEFYHLNRSTLEYCRERLRQDQLIWVMFDYKYHMQMNYFENKLSELGDLAQGVRFTVPYDFEEKFLLNLIRIAKRHGKKISLNLMYAHKYLENQSSFRRLQSLAAGVEVISLVDSYGVLLPTQVSDLIALMNRKFDKNKIGFHGHNNQELASANALSALLAGASCVDCTFNGLGRGAGNVRTELFLATLSGVEDFSHLFDTFEGWRNFICEIEDLVAELSIEIEHGPSAPYAVAAVSAIPQSTVMSLLGLKRFTASEVVQLANNDHTQKITQGVHYRTRFVEAIVEPINIFIANSAQYDFSLTIAQSIHDKFKVNNVYFLDVNAFENFATEEIQQLFNCVIISSELKLQSLDANNQLQMVRVLSTPPHISDNNVGVCISPVITLNSPMEVALIDSGNKNMKNIVFWGIDGDRGAAVDETEEILAHPMYSEYSFYSFTPTGYKIGGVNAFS